MTSSGSQGISSNESIGLGSRTQATPSPLRTPIPFLCKAIFKIQGYESKDGQSLICINRRLIGSDGRQGLNLCRMRYTSVNDLVLIRRPVVSSMTASSH